MLVYGVNRIAKVLGCSPITVRRIISKHEDFPFNWLSDIGTFEFNTDACQEWWDTHRNVVMKKQIPTNALQQSKFAQKLGVSTRLIAIWRQRGLPAEKLTDGSVWINRRTAKQWFLEQKDERTKFYAEKI
ncbi:MULTISPECIES: hypothetical protein [unclassified Paenibacillus]|uniref:hypothetical protein n=1 Tax=unclassified Paenibacillus TaxID=185978 RepID=UPI0024066C2F|nr:MULTISPECIES: hypothetical protein [unclassified Paenibacillus]MDF9839061.1 hypothetical protein [Paenibacillus sp. PastF-2]MDF9845643.1 hypothetical protein [Paenibacillus sp. PastM-2]MDF9852215.1 hypothetical protein [Paenibacillus sp. PastF-1]MDH6478056.1 hypothetical protein [Paenibacillus sp. PastH-2]MDH6505791.1 hypothetical protein [Paenibacillus sp. PastM-3]